MKLIRTRHFDNTVRLVLVGQRGRKWTKAVVLTTPIRVVKVDNKIADRFETFEGSIPKAKRLAREFASWTYSEGLPKTLTNFLKGA